jgi:hypothetical protein
MNLISTGPLTALVLVLWLFGCVNAAESEELQSYGILCSVQFFSTISIIEQIEKLLQIST